MYISIIFFMLLLCTNPVGPKPDEIKSNQKINSIKRIIAEINPEQLNAYSLTFVKLLNWLRLAIEARRDSVINRTLNTKLLKAEREQAIQQEEERKAERTRSFNDEKEKWEKKYANRLKLRLEDEPAKNRWRKMTM